MKPMVHAMAWKRAILIQMVSGYEASALKQQADIC